MTLEERVRLNRVVWRKALQIREKYGKPFTIISSGHISDTIEDQIRELRAVAESGTDVLVFITNRLDPQNQGDDVWISNAERLLDALPAELPLGLYESPYPYKKACNRPDFDLVPLYREIPLYEGHLLQRGSHQA